jgi:N-hydroxyarylamine O-acetyltransferase
MDLDAYFRRIGYHGGREPTLETLRGMVRAHFYNVPFENLDIARGVRIEVDGAVNYAKVVGAGRGGFCLEVTGLFARVLRQMGYRVDVLRAGVIADGQPSTQLGHMALIVHLDERWIVDVGFGGRIAAPLRLEERGEQRAEGRTYVVENDGDHWSVTCSEPWTPAMTYVFTLRPTEFSELHEVCDWLQTSPDSRFTRGDVVSLATPTGRKTFAGKRLSIAVGDTREEREITSEDERAEVLREHFGIRLRSGD